ncbi:hypothetical protein K3495_g8655 [Podosphaera aphanis]|nr:hypothetical protein K3495_g8655 [Podosphaera aphanis]
MLVFVIQAIKAKQRNQNRRSNIWKHVKTWGEFNQEPLMHTSDSEKDNQPPLAEEKIDQIAKGFKEDITDDSHHQNP